MPINIMALMKAFDAVLSFGSAVKRLKEDRPAETGLTLTGGDPAVSQIEARLTNVVVAALKGAFDRDRARLDLERSLQDEQRRRAEEALRLELRRQTVERELARLRLLAGAASLGWVVSVLMAVRPGEASSLSRAALAAGWLLLIGALGSAFTAQRRVSAQAIEHGQPPGTAWATTAVWLLVAGLSLVTMSTLI